MLEDLAGIIWSDTFWVAVGAIGAVIALILAYKQLKASRIIAAADFLLRLENEFNSEKMMTKRKQILLVLKQTPRDFEKINTFRDVFDFFEELGLLLRKKIIPKDLVWSDYCYWTLNYWTAFRAYIEWARESDSDPTMYCEFEYLFKRMRSYEEHKLARKCEMTPQKTAEFVNDELKLVSSETKCI